MRDEPARICHSDHNRTGALSVRLGRIHRRQPCGNGRAVAGELAGTSIACPIAQTKGGFGVALFHRVAEKQQVRLR